MQLLSNIQEHRSGSEKSLEDEAQESEPLQAVIEPEVEEAQIEASAEILKKSLASTPPPSPAAGKVEDGTEKGPKLQTVLLPSQEIELHPNTGNLPDGEYAIEPSMNCKASSNALTWLQPNILEVKGPPSTEFVGRLLDKLPHTNQDTTTSIRAIHLPPTIRA